MIEFTRQTVHTHSSHTLRLRNRTILVRQQQSLQIDNLLAQLRDLCAERVVLAAEDLHLGLEVGKPLLLSLTTFQCGDPDHLL